MRAGLRFTAVIGLCGVAAAQSLPREERIRGAVVRVVATDIQMQKANALIARRVAAAQLKQIRIQQPYRLETSGVVVSPKGEIVTTALHPRAQLAVTVRFRDGVEEEATVIGTDPWSNLALIKVDRETPLYLAPAAGATTLRQQVDLVGDGAVERMIHRAVVVKEQVGVMIPDLYGVSDTPTLLMGSVFAVSGPAAELRSGSACVNTKGELAGMVLGQSPAKLTVTPKRLRAVQVSFVVPGTKVARILKDLRRHGRVIRALFGLKIRPVEPALRAHLPELPASASAVVDVARQSAAARAGFRVHDVVLQVQGRSYRDFNELAEALSDCRPRAEVSVKILRAGKTIELKPTPDER